MTSSYDGGRSAVCERRSPSPDEKTSSGVPCWKDPCVPDAPCNWELNWGLWLKVFSPLYLSSNGVLTITVPFCEEHTTAGWTTLTAVFRLWFFLLLEYTMQHVTQTDTKIHTPKAVPKVNSVDKKISSSLETDGSEQQVLPVVLQQILPSSQFTLDIMLLYWKMILLLYQSYLMSLYVFVRK